MVGSTITNAKSVNLSHLVIFDDFSDGKSTIGTPSQNEHHSEHDDSAIDLTTDHKGVAQPVQNLPQDLTFCDTEPQLEPDDEPLNNGDNHDSDPQCPDFTGPGTHTYCLYNYKYRVETLSNHLINIPNVTV